MSYGRRALLCALTLALALCLTLPAAAARPIPAGNAHLVSDPSPYWNVEPTAAAASQGRFLTVWNDLRHGLTARFVNPQGQPVGTVEVIVANTPFPTESGLRPYLHNSSPMLVGIDGGFLLFYTEERGKLSWSYFWTNTFPEDRDVRVQRLNAAGRPVGESVRLSTSSDGQQVRPTAARLADGSVVALWEDFEVGGSTSIAGRLLDGNGTPAGNGFTLEDASQPIAVAAEDGGFLLGWTASDDAGSGVFARLYDAAGEPAAEAVQVNVDPDRNQYSPALAATGDGFVMIWQTTLVPGIETRLYGRSIAVDGLPFGGEVGIGDAEITRADSVPRVARMSDGGLFVSWIGWKGDFPRYVLAQPLDDDLTAIDVVQPVSQEKPQSHLSLSLATSGDATFVTWEGRSGRAHAVTGRAFETGRKAAPLTLVVAGANR
jgi:hypothetical protein